METNAWLARQDQTKVEDMLTKLREAEWMRHGRNWLDMAHGDESFALWLVMADSRCSRLIGLGIFDIEDYTWADEYEAGSSPSEAVVEALRSDDLYSSLFDAEV